MVEKRAPLFSYLQQIAEDRDRQRLPIMPQAKLTYDNFRASGSGGAAVLDWLNATKNYSLESGVGIEFGAPSNSSITACGSAGLFQNVGFEFDAQEGDRIDATVTTENVSTGEVARGVSGADAVPLVRLLLRETTPGTLRPIGDPAVRVAGTQRSRWAGIAPSSGRYAIGVFQTGQVCLKSSVSLAAR